MCRRLRLGRRLSVLATICGLALSVAACAKTASSPSAAGNSAAGNSAAGNSAAGNSASAASCGTIPTKPPADPDGVLAKLPASVQAAYNLYPEPVYASAWAHWKPAHPGPYTVAVSAGEFADPFTVAYVGELEQLKAHSTLIKSLLLQSADVNAQTQIRQLQQDITNKVDLIIAFPVSPAADAAVLQAAGKAGIPVIAPLNAAASPYAVGFNGNQVLQGAALTQGLTRIIGGKGGLLEMQGTPGIAASDLVLQGTADVLKSCPGMTVVGKPVGEFTPSVAKTQTLEFLAAHPQPIAAAIQVGGMATGMIQAFQQTGRTVPPIGDLGATPGALAYWGAHKGSYNGVALAQPIIPEADATWDIAQGLLDGRGIRVSEILQNPVLITDANLSQWVQPGWTLDTPLANAPGPQGVFYSSAFLDQFFTNPSK
jgi:ribose transport system substrate-binding protein